MHAHNSIVMPVQVFEAALSARAAPVVPGRETVAELLLRDATKCSPVVLHDHDQRLCLPESTQVQASRNVDLGSVLSREQGDDEALSAYLTFVSKSTFKVKRFKSLCSRDTAAHRTSSAHQDIARAKNTEDDPLWGHNQTGSKPIPVAAHDFAPGDLKTRQ